MLENVPSRYTGNVLAGLCENYSKCFDVEPGDLHFSHLDLLMINWLMYNTGQCWNFELGQVIMSDAVSSMCRICTTQRLACSHSAASQQQWQLWVQINFEFHFL
jgi:hypothetical protein